MAGLNGLSNAELISRLMVVLERAQNDSRMAEQEFSFSHLDRVRAAAERTDTEKVITEVIRRLQDV